jgi:hypothetical protein
MQVIPKARSIQVTSSQTRSIRAIADAKATVLAQIGIRLLKNYHTLVRAHALRHNRSRVNSDDLDFLRQVDQFISITECRKLD